MDSPALRRLGDGDAARARRRGQGLERNGARGVDGAGQAALEVGGVEVSRVDQLRAEDQDLHAEVGVQRNDLSLSRVAVVRLGTNAQNGPSTGLRAA